MTEFLGIKKLYKVIWRKKSETKGARETISYDTYEEADRMSKSITDGGDNVLCIHESTKTILE